MQYKSRLENFKARPAKDRTLTELPTPPLPKARTRKQHFARLTRVHSRFPESIWPRESLLLLPGQAVATDRATKAQRQTRGDDLLKCRQEKSRAPSIDASREATRCFSIATRETKETQGSRRSATRPIARVRLRAQGAPPRKSRSKINANVQQGKATADRPGAKGRLIGGAEIPANGAADPARPAPSGHPAGEGSSAP